MNTVSDDSVFFYIRVPEKLAPFQVDPEDHAFYLQHRVFCDVIPTLSDAKISPVRKMSFIIDLKDNSSLKSLKIVSKNIFTINFVDFFDIKFCLKN